ncbi:TRAP-type C4-dicarboxylate transport system, small permease component [Variovorax sp. PBS-H4]|uniref:TRAP transporter small permease subunit n=1 Tax=Variovorax sp. PBS-H4 TaxID=434008 RepID=UPI0013186141|nr:TRAP transporter small permease [Variovorax sp. PBS-H4]VTU28471.1 TRAP-type C4-dicarboxylate transport system, small permease component [Variovorax sp. PBS-H4]
MRRLLDAVYEACGYLGAFCVLTICVVMVGQSLGRVAGMPTGGANDLVAWLCAAAAFLPMAHAFRHGDFVRVTLVFDKLGARSGRVLEVVALCVACIAIAYLAWWATVFTWESWEFHEMGTGMLAWPLWIPQLSFVVGAWVFLIAVLDEAAIVLRGGVPTYVAAVQERHARGDFSSDI